MEKITKLAKEIKSTGGGLMFVGIFMIVINIGLYIGGLLDSRFLNLPIPHPDLTSLVISIAISSIFIILGNRIRKNIDDKTKKYLIVTLVLTILTCLIISITGAKVGYILIILLVYLMKSLGSLSTLMKDADFKSGIKKTDYLLGTKFWIVFIIITLVAGFFAFRYDTKDMVSADSIKTPEDKQRVVKEIVAGVNQELKLPIVIDNRTILSSVEEGDHMIQYNYSVHDITLDQLNQSSLKTNLIASICSNSGLKQILGLDINLGYKYMIKGTNDVVSLTLTKTDCQK